VAIRQAQSDSIGAPRPSAATLNWAAAFVLMLALLGLRLTVCGHPWPVHPDESEFVAAIGFPRPYPVHPPGYPLWVALGTLLTRTGLSPYVAYQSMSVAASCFGPAVLFFLLRGMVGAGIAWWAAFALGVNPVWWFEGVTALNYSAANCLGIVIVAACWKWMGRGPHSRDSMPDVALATLGTGLRPDMLMWYGPLVVWSAWRARAGWLGRSLVMAVFAVAISVALSFVLFPAGQRASVEHTSEVLWSTSVFSRGFVNGVVRNAVKLGAYLGWGVGIGGVVFVWSVIHLSRRHVRSSPYSSQIQGEGIRVTVFFVLWILPVLLFQLLVHMTELGHALWYFPVIYTVMAIALGNLRSRRCAVVILAMTSCASIAQFFLYPWRADVSGWQRVLNAKVAFASAAGLKQINQRDLIHQPNDFWTVPDVLHSDP